MAHAATSVGKFNTFSAPILDWLRVVSPSSVTNRTPSQAWISYLQGQLGSQSQNRSELERMWLQSRITALGGSTPAGATLPDCWEIYLTKKGFTGDTTDMFAQWIDGGAA